LKPSLREVLRHSHVAAVAIAVLLLWTLDNGFRALWEPLSRAIPVLFTAIAILDIPESSRRLTVADYYLLVLPATYFCYALIPFVAACLISRWVYGVEPLRALHTFRENLTRRHDV